MRLLVALSGGVDSSVAALLLQREGHSIVGAYMKNWINEDNIAGDCPWARDIEDARAVADRLGIEFRIVNQMEAYRRLVVDPLLSGYRAGDTPNPDVWCNREIKFGVFLDYAQREGFDGVATGHYARRRDRPDGGVEILQGCDPNKDQTYFLALLSQSQVRQAHFPVGHLLKPELRRLAADAGLPTAAKKDSQGICFIGQVRMEDFMRAYLGDAPGDIVDISGRILGRHRGLHYFTLGQRKGIGVPSNTEGEAFVVVAKRPATRELVVAFDRPGSPGLYASRCTLAGLSWVSEPPPLPARLLGRPRYRDRPQRLTLSASAVGDAAQVDFEQPQRALTPGQILALYEGERLLGGGSVASVGS